MDVEYNESMGVSEDFYDNLNACLDASRSETAANSIIIDYKIYQIGSVLRVLIEDRKRLIEEIKTLKKTA